MLIPISFRIRLLILKDQGLTLYLKSCRFFLLLLVVYIISFSHLLSSKSILCPVTIGTLVEVLDSVVGYSDLLMYESLVPLGKGKRLFSQQDLELVPVYQQEL